MSVWKHDHVALLTKLWPSAMPPSEIFNRFPGFTETVVRRKAEALGLRRGGEAKLVLPPQYWTADRDKKLRDLAAKGLTSAQIGERMGKSAPSIAKRAKELGVTLCKPAPLKTPPKPKGKNAVRAMIKQQAQRAADHRDKWAKFTGQDIVALARAAASLPATLSDGGISGSR